MLLVLTATTAILWETLKFLALLGLVCGVALFLVATTRSVVKEVKAKRAKNDQEDI
jgi:hypothetical protein